MQVILKQDVPHVGLKYEVKDVANGYAQNHLLPRKLAELATPAKMRKLADKRVEAEKQHAARHAEMAEQFKGAHGNVVHLAVKANEQGHLFQGIKADQVAEVLNEKLSLSITADFITRQEPIKDLGEYEIELVSEDVKATVTLVVKAE